MYAGNSATTKVTNAAAQSEAARERAEREASEHSRQIASREKRALKRSSSAIGPRNARSANLRTKQISTVKLTRHTTVSFKHRLPKTGMLKAVKKSSNLHFATRRNASELNTRQDSRHPNRPSTPSREIGSQNSDSEEDMSPNITPASLRSASGKASRISPASQERIAKRSLSKPEPKHFRSTQSHTISKAKLQQRVHSSAPKSLRQTGAGVRKLYHVAQSRSRSARGR